MTMSVSTMSIATASSGPGDCVAVIRTASAAADEIVAATGAIQLDSGRVPQAATA